MKMMTDLPSKVLMLRPADKEKAVAPPEGDEFAAAIQAAKAQSGGPAKT